MFIYTVKDIVQAVFLGGLLLVAAVAFGCSAAHDIVAWLRKRWKR